MIKQKKLEEEAILLKYKDSLEKLKDFNKKTLEIISSNNKIIFSQHNK